MEPKHAPAVPTNPLHDPLAPSLINDVAQTVRPNENQIHQHKSHQILKHLLAHNLSKSFPTTALDRPTSFYYAHIPHSALVFSQVSTIYPLQLPRITPSPASIFASKVLGPSFDAHRDDVHVVVLLVAD